MVMINQPADQESEEAGVDARTYALMGEFEAHFREVVARHPDLEDRREHVFQAWAMQKIAGLQLAVETIAEKFNAHIGS